MEEILKLLTDGKVDDSLIQSVKSKLALIVQQKESANDRANSKDKELIENKKELEIYQKVAIKVADKVGIDLSEDGAVDKLVDIDLSKDVKENSTKINRLERELKDKEEKLNNVNATLKSKNLNEALSDALRPFSEKLFNSNMTKAYMKNLVIEEGGEFKIKLPDGNVLSVANGVKSIIESNPTEYLKVKSGSGHQGGGGSGGGAGGNETQNKKVSDIIKQMRR